MVKDSLGNIIKIGDEVERIEDSFNGMEVGDKATVIRRKKDTFGETIYLDRYNGGHTAKKFKVISKTNEYQINLIL